MTDEWVFRGAHNVNHVAAGAWIANHFDKQAARAIYGHHDGLVWYIGSDIDRSLNEKSSQDSQKGKRFSISEKEQYKELSDYYKAHSIPCELTGSTIENMRALCETF